ncbi:MAG: GIY-YIG nuclease family protein [Edaphobacter sp.]
MQLQLLFAVAVVHALVVACPFVCHSAAKRRNLLFYHQFLHYPQHMPNREYHFYVYILASRSRSLYVGFTNDIRLRIKQHREKRQGTHTAKYNIGRLVYYEHFTYVLNAIAREKELKDWNRAKKVVLIEQGNPTWEDLAAEW